MMISLRRRVARVHAHVAATDGGVEARVFGGGAEVRVVDDGVETNLQGAVVAKITEAKAIARAQAHLQRAVIPRSMERQGANAIKLQVLANRH